uniref:Uncharacterized protein n=1 Tax=Steinernema glaseri TaxID=37863 RepID=A0A1I8AIH8_9BILA
MKTSGSNYSSRSRRRWPLKLYQGYQSAHNHTPQASSSLSESVPEGETDEEEAVLEFSFNQLSKNRTNYGGGWVLLCAVTRNRFQRSGTRHRGIQGKPVDVVDPSKDLAPLISPIKDLAGTPAETHQEDSPSVTPTFEIEPYSPVEFWPLNTMRFDSP